MSFDCCHDGVRTGGLGARFSIKAKKRPIPLERTGFIRAPRSVIWREKKIREEVGTVGRVPRTFVVWTNQVIESTSQVTGFDPLIAPRFGYPRSRRS